MYVYIYIYIHLAVLCYLCCFVSFETQEQCISKLTQTTHVSNIHACNKQQRGSHLTNKQTHYKHTIRHIHTTKCVYVYVYECVYTYIYIYICVYVSRTWYIHIYIYICIHIIICTLLRIGAGASSMRLNGSLISSPFANSVWYDVMSRYATLYYMLWHRVIQYMLHHDISYVSIWCYIIS